MDARLQPLTALTAELKGTIRLVATDMDGTLTIKEKFTTTLFQALEKLTIAQLPVLIVTGRSAGWVAGIVHYLPVVGAIAENGGIYFKQDSDEPQILVPLPEIGDHRQRLAGMFEILKQKYPQLQEAEDNRFRLSDWTFDISGLSAEQLQWMSECCQENNWGFTYSSVQCHIKPLHQEKASSLLRVLEQYFPQLSPNQVMTIGDSPNDESLFDAEKFPYSVGVQNLLPYRDRLSHLPAFITPAREGEGFSELAQFLSRLGTENS